MERRMLVFAAFHYDVAYRETFEGYMPQCIEIIDASLDLLEEFPEYVFNIEQIILLDAYWQRCPKQRKRLIRFARENRLIFCPGTWTMPDVNIPSAESYYRNALLGRQWLSEQLGVQPGPVCWMADVFGHNPQSPQIWSQLGYKLYMFERGQLVNEESIDFLWRGIDGTKLFTHWEKDTYYGIYMGLAWSGNRSREWLVKRIHQVVVDPLSEENPGTLFTKIGGDFLLPKKNYLEFVEWWNENGQEPPIVFEHPRAYIEELETRRNVKVIAGDFNPLMQGAYTTRIRIKQHSRETENLLYACEALKASLGIDSTEELKSYWQRLTTLHFHDIICGSLAEKAWKESLQACVQLKADLQKAIEQTIYSKKSKDIVLFNPLPYPRTEVVDLPEGPKCVCLEAHALISTDNASTADEMPPVSAEGGILDNGLLRIEVDELGRVVSLLDHTTSKSYTDSRYGYLHDIMLEPDYGDPWVPHQGPVNCSLLHAAPIPDPPFQSGVEVSRQGAYETRGADSQCFNLPELETTSDSKGARGEILVTHKSEGYGIKYVLNAGERMLRIRVEHKYGSVQTRLRAIIPTGITNGTIRREVPAGWIKQDEGEYPAQNWMDYADEEKGLCLLNRGLPGNNVTQGVMLLTLFRAIALIEPGILPDYEQDVTQVADYALCPFAVGDSDYRPSRLGHLFNQPILVLNSSVVPETERLSFSLESDKTEMMAMRLVDNGKVELRLHESMGQAGSLSLKSSQHLTQVLKVTPLGAVLEKLDIKEGNRVEFDVRPFEIVTLQMI